MLTSAKMSEMGHRWLAALATKDFCLKYRPGKSHIDAGALSRQTHYINDMEDWVWIPPAGVKAVCQQVGVGNHSSDLPKRTADQLGISPDIIPPIYVCPVSLEQGCFKLWTHRDINAAQRSDPGLKDVWVVKKNAQPANIVSSKHPDVALLLREWDHLNIKEGVLYRTVKIQPEGELDQLVLPAQYQFMALKAFCEDHGHLGIDRTVELVQSQFYWPRMTSEIESHVKNCGTCI